MAALAETTKKKIVFWSGVSVLSVLAVLLLLLVLAAIFPNQFEAMGITMFHNRETGVFADCFSDSGANIPACKLKTKKALHERIFDFYSDPKSTRKPRIIPFTFD